MNIQFNLIRHPEFLLSLSQMVYLGFIHHMKKSTTFPAIFVTDNEELARKGYRRTDLSLISDFDVVILMIDRDDDHSESLPEEIYQITSDHFDDMLYAILQAYR